MFGQKSFPLYTIAGCKINIASKCSKVTALHDLNKSSALLGKKNSQMILFLDNDFFTVLRESYPRNKRNISCPIIYKNTSHYAILFLETIPMLRTVKPIRQLVRCVLRKSIERLSGM